LSESLLLDDKMSTKKNRVSEDLGVAAEIRRNNINTHFCQKKNI